MNLFAGDWDVSERDFEDDDSDTADYASSYDYDMDDSDDIADDERQSSKVLCSLI